MPRVTLTDLAIQRMKPSGQQVFYRCNRTPSFGLRLSQAGGKSFFAIIGRKYHHLGKYPAVSLQDARREASRLLDAGPSPTKQSVSAGIETYLSTHISRNYRPRSAAEAERLLKKHLSAHLSRDVGSLSSRDITAILDTLKPSEANHFFGVLRTFLNWCERRELIEQSPIRKLSKPNKENSRDRVLTSDEIRKVWNASASPSTFHSIIRLCLLTGQRRGEIAGIRPEWISGDVLTFPKEITKNKTEHTIPLTSHASTLASALGTGSDPYKTWSKPKAALDTASGVSNWTIHDLRRTVSTNLGEMGTQPHIIDRLLNHSTGALSALARRYNRYAYMPEMRQALVQWEAKLLGIVGERG